MSLANMCCVHKSVATRNAAYVTYDTWTRIAMRQYNKRTNNLESKSDLIVISIL